MKYIQPKKAKNLPAEYKELEEQQELIVLPSETLTPVQYLESLVGQMKDDIYPLFRTKGGAPFTVTRNTMCYIDHVSQLLYGIKGSQNSRLIKVINQLGSIDSYLNSNYSKYATYLIQIYRHDLVHNVRPFPKKVLIKEDGILNERESWFFMITNCDGKDFETNQTYMSAKRSRKGRNHLRLADNQVTIDTFSLFFDTVSYINSLIDALGTDRGLSKSITKNYYSILRKNYFKLEKFEIDKSTNKQISGI